MMLWQTVQTRSANSRFGIFWLHFCYHLIERRFSTRCGRWGARMTWYRTYFHSASGSIQGRDEFEAKDDREAMILAEHLFDACSDVCASFELWDGGRRVDTSFTKMPCPSVSAVSARMQDSLMRREEALQRSGWALARSRRLLERMQGLENK